MHTISLRHLGLANGIAAAGSGVGGLVISPMLQIFLQTYGLADTFYMLGALMLFTAVFATLFTQPAATIKPSALYEGLLEIAFLRRNFPKRQIAVYRLFSTKNLRNHWPFWFVGCFGIFQTSCRQL